MSVALSRLHDFIPPLLAPVHTMAPVPLLDIYGAMRLSSIVNWAATGVFDPPTAVEVTEKGNKKRVTAKRARASLLQELSGLMVVVFGGETFLCMCTGTPPSWMTNPKLALLFCGIHTVQTRTPLRSLLPAGPSLFRELLLALPDAVARTLLLTRFSILPLLNSTSVPLPPTPSTLVLVPFILAVPFAAIAFSGLNLFSHSPKVSTPAELQPLGWTGVDAWAPVVVPMLFLSLIGPVKGWSWGLGWGEDEAVVACVLFLWAAFTGKAIYNLGYKREQWEEMLGGTKTKKVKTA